MSDLSTANLNAGGGICRPEAQLIIRPTRSALELGSGLDAMRSAFSSLHAVNRNSGDQGYLAASFPEMGLEKRNGPGGGLRCGTEFVAIGTHSLISTLADFDLIRRAAMRGLIEPVEPDEIFVEIGDECAAWYRDRRPERTTPAAKRRRRLRDERLGFDTYEGKSPKDFEGQYATLRSGKVTTYIGMQKAVWQGEEIKVSSYGLCGRKALSVLPVAIATDSI